MITCHTALEKPEGVRLNDELLTKLLDKHWKALETYPDVPRGSSDGIVIFDVFSDGRITAKFSGYSIYKDKITEKLYIIWERTAVGHN